MVDEVDFTRAARAPPLPDCLEDMLPFGRTEPAMPWAAEVGELPNQSDSLKCEWDGVFSWEGITRCVVLAFDLLFFQGNRVGADPGGQGARSTVPKLAEKADCGLEGGDLQGLRGSYTLSGPIYMLWKSSARFSERNCTVGQPIYTLEEVADALWKSIYTLGERADTLEEGADGLEEPADTLEEASDAVEERADTLEKSIVVL